MIIRKTPLLAAVAAVLAPSAALATNGYQLIGVGAYQKSLAGAVTANPGSAMTAVTNPAGSARVGSRADFSMEAFMPERDVNFSASGGETGDSAVDMYGVPALGWTAPVADGSDVYFGGGMYGTSGMGVDYAGTKMMGFPPALPLPDMYWDGYSNIAFWQMAPTLAWNVNPRLSVGGSLNIDYQSVSFRQRVMADLNGDGSGDRVMSNFDLGRSASGFGLGLSFGLLYDATDRLTVGAAYKSKQYFDDLEYQLAQGDITHPDIGGAGPAGTYKLDLDFPQQLALGLAFDATDRFTVSADVKWIDWSDTMGKLAVKGPGVSLAMDPGWDDQTVYALGLSYAVSDSVNVRAGYNYAESPIDEMDVSSNLILPAVVETHYTVGADWAINERWQVAAHYMFVPETSFTAPSDDPMTPGAEISLSEQSFGANIGYRF